MKNIIVIGHGDASALAAVRERYPEAEVITYEEAERRNIVTEGFVIKDIPIIDHRDIPILQDINIQRKDNSQTWKRRGNNTKV